MAQFDVYVNPQAASRQFVPYLVDIQSALIDQLTTRLVVPLFRMGSSADKLPRRLIPLFEVAGEVLAFLPHQAAPVQVRLLKKPIMSLHSRADEMTSALDAVVSGV